MESKKIIAGQKKKYTVFKMLVPLSIQHMFAMFGASVLVPFIFGIIPGNSTIYERYRTHCLFILITKGKAPVLSWLQLCIPGTGGNCYQQMGLYCMRWAGFAAAWSSLAVSWLSIIYKFGSD